jgi:hypothetical protein
MTKTEAQAVRRAISLLCSVIDLPQECAPLPLPPHSPSRRFVQEYLIADANADITCEEAWTFFQEVVEAGELFPVRKAVFLREGCLLSVWAATNCLVQSRPRPIPRRFI